jgi:hypothetical protein
VFCAGFESVRIDKLSTNISCTSLPLSCSRIGSNLDCPIPTSLYGYADSTMRLNEPVSIRSGDSAVFVARRNLNCPFGRKIDGAALRCMMDLIGYDVDFTHSTR